ncbi:MAG: YgcG family protein, partial [Burkholderiales bacterium]
MKLTLARSAVVRVALLLAMVLAGAAAFAQEFAPIPSLAARVTDTTGTLTAQQRQALEANLSEFEARKGSQIAVLIVPTTQPEEIEQYAIRVADAWKVGRKNVDDGIIVVVAKNDRKMRLEVGRGLEGAVPDAYAKRIVSDIMAPRFKEGDFYGGLRAATQTLEQLISGEQLPAPTQRSPGPSGGIGGMGLEAFLIVLLVGTMVIGGILTSIFGRFLGSIITGGVVGGLSWMIVGVLAAALGAGFLAFIFSLILGGSRGG